MKTSIIALLLIGNFASAATEWTTKPVRVRAKAGDVCTLTIDTAIVVPRNAKSDYDDVTVKINELLNKNVLRTSQDYYRAVGELGARCDKSRAGGLSAALVTSLIHTDASWSSWQQNMDGFLGGAHGYVVADRLVISANGDLVTFDTVLAISREDFINTVVSKLKAMGRYSEDSFNFWAENKDNLKMLNYYANNDGISIFFNSYVIASYAAGPTEISYTWAELKSMLKANSVFANKLK